MTGASRHRAAGGLLLGLALLAGCHTGSRQTDVEMEVRRVAVDPASQSPVVLLENHDHTLILPIWIGLSEAQAIAMQIEGVDPPRPLTHDLVKTVFDRIGVQLNKVLISELRGSTYYARLFLASNGTEWEIDSRPSDAIALALRCGAPVYVEEKVFNEAGVTLPEEKGGEPAKAAGGKPDMKLTPLENLQKRLDEAIQSEHYEDAARLRDEIKRLRGPHAKN